VKYFDGHEKINEMGISEDSTLTGKVIEA